MDVLHIGNIKNVGSYDAVVVGSAIKSNSWHSNAIEFVKKNQAELKQIPVIYFLTCLALYYNTDKNKQIAKNYFTPVLKAVPGIKPKNKAREYLKKCA